METARKYLTTKWKAYDAALKARGDLRIGLNKDMQWLAPASGKRGRSQKFSDTAIQFCQTVKCLFGQPLRQTLGYFSRCSKWLAYLGQHPTTARCVADKKVYMFRCTTAQVVTACTCLPTPQIGG